MTSSDSFGTRSTLDVGGRSFTYYDLGALERSGAGDPSRLPFCLKVLLENLLRHEDGKAVDRGDVEALLAWSPDAGSDREISFTPARVLLQDFTGVPAIVDLAAMRDAMAEMGGDPALIDPLLPAELVIDHSVQVDSFGSPDSFRINADREMERNRERYTFLRWGQTVFRNFRVVPPDTGIVHQVNLEHLARVVFDAEGPDGTRVAYPDTLVGTDSHTTMVNGVGVLGWGVGGIEAEAAMLGQPIPLLVPDVVGVRLHGTLPAGSTATDLVLTITERLRQVGVVAKFVEFFGPGLGTLSLADRATLGNMSPEYGSTCAIFPIDGQTLDYLRMTGRSAERIELVEAYAKAQGMFWSPDAPEAGYTEVVDVDLAEVVPSIAGPKRPQDRISLAGARGAYEQAFADVLASHDGGGSASVTLDNGASTTFDLRDGAVVVAAITSCTNTSNPSVMVGAGLLAKKAVERGLTSHPWVKTSLAPGSKVVTEYLERAGLIEPLEALGFHLVGYGCTTCIGNTGPLAAPIEEAIRANDLVACAVLSGNRNFEGRIHALTRGNYLASPPLVVAYALAGRMDLDLTTQPLGQDGDGKDVFLADVWPSPDEVRDVVQRSIGEDMFRESYADVFTGDQAWRALPVPEGDRFTWDDASTYVRRPGFLAGVPAEAPPLADVEGGPRPAGARRLGDHRPHLARRIDRQGFPRRRVPHRQRGRAAGLQQLRVPPREPRGHGPGDVRQRPTPEPARPRHRGGLDPAPAGRRAGVDLRRRPPLPRGGRAPGRARGQGVRVGLVPGLGRQGHRHARHPGRDRRELRADPPEQPDRHGGAAPPAPRG